MPVAILIILLVVGTLVFHFLSPWTFTPLASNWGAIDQTIDITLWVTGFVFVAVNLFMAYAIIKYRAKDDGKATYDPENTKLEFWLTAFTTVGIVAMLAPGLLVWNQFVNVPDDAMNVEVIGQQWHWSYRFPGEDGKFGNVDTKLVSDSNPFGMDSDDPAGEDDVLINSAELHLPVNVPISMHLRSKDVLHNYTVAQFRVKMDLVPGMITNMWFTPTEVGRYDVLCEELCGVAHHTMRGAVIVEEQSNYDSWLANYPTYKDTKQRLAGNSDFGASQYAVCAACHGQQGEGSPLLNAPKIAGQDEWYIEKQLKNYKAGLRGWHPDDIYGNQMAPMSMTLVNEEAISNVIAYIKTLPDDPSPKTIDGDINEGAKTYVICAYCHGKDGQGIQEMNAPRMAGMTDWYIQRQLQNFKHGIRGQHPEDYYGKQMGFMARILQSDKKINDLVAYINTL